LTTINANAGDADPLDDENEEEEAAVVGELLRNKELSG
jgi:hypothetical protein